MEDIWKTAKGVLATVAPMLATAVGGPLAGTATSAIIGALGLAPDTPPDQVALAVQNASPEQLLALKKADHEYAVTMRKLDIDIVALGNADRDSARRREIALKDWMPKALGLLVVLTANTAVLLVLLGQAKVEGALAGAMVQMLVNSALVVLAYYFGSSAGSAEKNKMLGLSR